MQPQALQERNASKTLRQEETKETETGTGQNYVRYKSSLLVRASFKVLGSLEPIPVQTKGVQMGQVVTVSRIVAPPPGVTGCRVPAWQVGPVWIGLSRLP